MRPLPILGENMSRKPRRGTLNNKFDFGERVRYRFGNRATGVVVLRRVIDIPGYCCRMTYDVRWDIDLSVSRDVASQNLESA